MRHYNQEILGDCVSEVLKEDAKSFAWSLEWLDILLGYYDDPKQALRMRRYFLAAGTSFLAIGLLFACYWQDVLSSTAFYRSATLVLLAVIAFYILFRLGLNLRFNDPNLALPQILASSLITLYAMYEADGARSVFLILLLMSYLFSVLQLTTRGLLIYAVGILGAYGCVIGLLWRFKPLSLGDRKDSYVNE
ncbi:hypothetical protein QN360_01895 [Glaciimonas sp. CA11.2]|uniref:hypothetical protein n=1 Tax=unclassified Glaciimonas TaxID=2644401 RepID=UPI002AB465F0|nr:MULTISPECIES: hypothetical protein [unclassified Glaciimonas]MDY7549230.1 hypothetical protein [Glaciimonas sp. CA11.2]MEB0013964.1 hypothetical protein [Glaciimonas sp. Cout2]MEB0083168.1 hypothetical protein [Glaciimonas sp. Gout2]MEB0161659.1 hypothetical protein [Glaciimonas sp. CA11.2]